MAYLWRAAVGTLLALASSGVAQDRDTAQTGVTVEAIAQAHIIDAVALVDGRAVRQGAAIASPRVDTRTMPLTTQSTRACDGGATADCQMVIIDLP